MLIKLNSVFLHFHGKVKRQVFLNQNLSDTFDFAIKQINSFKI